MCLALLAGCAGLPQRPSDPAAAAAGSGIYVVRRGWHVDVGLDAAALTPPLAAMRRDFPTARFLVFGFGDRQYLLHRGADSSDTARALWPGPALVLVTGLTAPPADAFGADHVIKLSIGVSGARQLQEYLWRSLAASRAGPQPLASGPYPGSYFFEANGRYSALHTCNTWVAEALAAAGLRVQVAGVVFAGQVWSQARRPAGSR